MVRRGWRGNSREDVKEWGVRIRAGEAKGKKASGHVEKSSSSWSMPARVDQFPGGE